MKILLSDTTQKILSRILAILGAAFVISLAISYICAATFMFFPTKTLTFRNISLSSLNLSMYLAIPVFAIFIMLYHQRK